MSKTCSVCGSKIASDRTVCSVSCRQVYASARGVRAKQEKAKLNRERRLRTCDFCDQETTNKKFCSRSCAAKANNVKYPKRLPEVTRGSGFCSECGKHVGPFSKVCGSKCAGIRRRKETYTAWWNNGLDPIGLPGFAKISTLRKLLIDHYGTICWKCGEDKIHPYSGLHLIEMDHINGDRTDNTRDNLRLLCIDCHSKTPTYKHLNRRKTLLE